MDVPIANRTETRRTVLLTGLGLLLAGCHSKGGGQPVQNKLPRASGGRLNARPGTTIARPLGPGTHTIPLPNAREALLFVPADGSTDGNGVSLVVSLHGAGGTGRQALDMLFKEAGRYNFAVLAPSSRGQSWDRILGEYGTDVAMFDACLEYAFSHVNVRLDALAISGFSDGASYALSLGLENGDLFRHVLAFSPGFAAPEAHNGEPRFFVSHGTRDSVLPINRCSRVVVSRLRLAGYSVEYKEFDGPHAVPQDIKDEAIRWWGLTPPAARK